MNWYLKCFKQYSDFSGRARRTEFWMFNLFTLIVAFICVFCDTFLGLGFNIASYSLLTSMIAQQCDLKIGEFIWTGGDVHLYLNHLEQAQQQLSRKPYPLPKLKIKTKPNSIFDYRFEDFELINYQSHPHIPAPISI